MNDADPVERDRAKPRPLFLHDFTEAVRTCGHTPAPGDVTVSCDDPATITVATMGRALTADIDEARANAELIVQAVNDREALIAALGSDEYEALVALSKA